MYPTSFSNISKQTQSVGAVTTKTEQPVETESDQGEAKGFVMEAAEPDSSTPPITDAP